MKGLGDGRLKDQRDIFVFAVDMFGIFEHRVGDIWGARFLNHEDVSWWRGPLEGEEVAGFAFLGELVTSS